MSNTTVPKMEEITKEQFYKVIYEMNLNVHPYPRGEYPYTTYWEFPNRQLFGLTKEQNTVDGKRVYPNIEQYIIAVN